MEKKLVEKKLVGALRARYEAQKAEAEATLGVYLNNSAGIGEHPQIVEEMSKQLEMLANAHDCIHVLDNHLDIE